MANLEQVLADARGEAQVLRKHGEGKVADAMERMADDVATAARDFLEWLSEDEARLRSGRSRAFLRARFPEWEADGLARQDGRRRRYRSIIITRRANVDAAREAARRAAREVVA